MKRERISVRLNSIMNAKGLRQKDVLEMVKVHSDEYGIKISKSDLSQYCSGKTEPSADKLFILALTLKTDVAWLLGFDQLNEKENLTNCKKDDVYIVLNKIIDRLSSQRIITYKNEVINEKIKTILETSLKNCIKLIEAEKQKVHFKTIEQAKLYLKEMNFAAFSGSSNMNDDTIIEIANVIYSEKNA